MSGGGGTSTTTTVRELSPEQRQLLAPVIPIAEDYVKNPPKQFPGSAIAGFNQTQLGAQQSALRGANKAEAVAGAARGTLGSALGQVDPTRAAQNFLMSGDLLNPNSNPVLAAQTEMAIRPIFDQLRESTLPGLRSDFVGGNMFGSSRQGLAEGRAVGDAVQTAGDVATGIQANNFNRGLDAMTSTASNSMDNVLRSIFASSDVGQLGLLPAQVRSAVGAEQQGMEQAKLSEQASRFSTEQMIPFLAAQDVAGLAYGLPGGPTSSSGTTPGQNPLGGLLGLGGMGLGYALGGPMGGFLGGAAGRTLGDLF
jgi:flavodoxin